MAHAATARSMAIEVGLARTAATLRLINTIISQQRWTPASAARAASTRYCNGLVHHRRNGAFHPGHQRQHLRRSQVQGPGPRRLPARLPLAVHRRRRRRAAPETDFMGAPRYDDPRTANTGVPDPANAWADIGAFEFVETADSDVDLVVTAVAGPSAVVSGENATVEWSVVNTGTGTATGPWHDTVSLAPMTGGEPLAAGQVAIGQGVVLGPGESHRAAATVRVPGGTLGNYRWQVRTNSQGDIFEGANWTNNTATAATPTTLTLKTLTVGGPAITGQFDDPDDMDWFMFLPDEDQDILLAIDLFFGDGTLALYVATGYMPDQQHFDFRSSQFNSPTATTLATNTSTQPHYVMARPQTLGTTPAGYRISATVPEFEVTSVSPSIVGNAGSVTLRISGGRLADTMTFDLVDSLGGTHTASSVSLVNASEVHATFQLLGAPLGSCSIRVTCGGTIRTLPNAVSIVQGGPGQVQFSVTCPSAIRPGRSGLVTITYKNVGSTDVIAPLFVLTADKANLKLLPFLNYARLPGADDVELPESSDPAYERVFTSTYFLGINQQGPAGVLPPGAGGNITITGIPTIPFGTVEFNVYGYTDSTEPVDWTGFRADLKPPFMPQEAWDVVMDNFIASAGHTMGEFNSFLAETATYLSSIGQPAQGIDSLVAFRLQLCGADALSRRWTIGALGRGQSHPWDIWGEATDDSATIYHVCGRMRRFASVGGSTTEYRGISGDAGRLAIAGDTWTLTEPDGTEMTLTADPNTAGRFRLHSIRDLNGNQNTMSYSGARLTSFTDSTGDTTTIEYNAQNRVSLIRDAVGRQAAFEYDSSGEHLIAATRRGSTIRFTYWTGAGPAREHAVRSVEHADGTRSYFEYDDKGRLERITDDTETNVISYAYNSIGATTISNSEGFSVTALMNEFGRPAAVSDSEGRELAFGYDANHRLESGTAPASGEVLMAHDALGNLRQTVDPKGFETSMAYGPHGRLTRLTDARGSATHHAFDARSNPTQIQYADGNSEALAHDDRGNLTSYTNARGQTIAYVYDSHDLVVSKRFPDGSHVDYGYDAHRNLVRITDTRSGETSFSYDAADRPISVAYPNGRRLDFTYDQAGRRIRMADQGDFAINYAYDNAGRLSRLTDSVGNLIVSYAYDVLGRILKEDKGNATSTTYSYDSSGQLAGVVNRLSNGTISSRFDYSHDGVGRCVGKSGIDGTWEYQYDPMGQLVRALFRSNHPGLQDQDLAYEYDGSGNLVGATRNGTTTYYNANSMNQYASIGSKPLRYDEDGNLAGSGAGPEAVSYSYDFEGRLTGVAGVAGTWSFEYDDLGNRIAATHNGARVRTSLTRLDWATSSRNTKRAVRWCPAMSTVLASFASSTKRETPTSTISMDKATHANSLPPQANGVTSTRICRSVRFYTAAAGALMVFPASGACLEKRRVCSTCGIATTIRTPAASPRGTPSI